MKTTVKERLSYLPVTILVAFALRLAIFLPVWHQRYAEAVTNFQFGAETGAVAAAIAQGRGFSSPLRMVQTGPTAWFAPVFPYFLAGIFKLFGVYSATSSLVIHLFDFAFSALTCWPIAYIAKRVSGRKTAVAAAWAWVFLPTSIFYSVEWVWDTSLAALWMAWLVAATVKLRGSDRLSWWIGYGALWSAGAMINPSLIAVLPLLALWAIWPLRNRLRPAVKLASASALILTIGIMPWTIRNYVVFHRFIPLRSNFGLELWLGNNKDVPDSWTWWLHPNDYLEEAQKYARMTEIPYMEEKGHDAWAYIRSHPEDTARFVFHRFVNHWLGLWDSPADLWPTAPWYQKLTIIFSCLFALLAWTGTLLLYRTRNAFSHPLGIVMLVFPLAFYLTHSSMRYRFPMDPAMLVLAVYAVQCSFSPATFRPPAVAPGAGASEIAAL